MKSYYLQILENVIGISLGILFLIGFYFGSEAIIIACGVGAFIFMISQLEGQAKNMGNFILMTILGVVISAFISKWYYGLLWVSSLYAMSQFFGLLALRSAKPQFEALFRQDKYQSLNLKELLIPFVLIIIPSITYYYLAN